jgi:hypothetical protein
MGTAWTYQGRLMEREQSAKGLYDLQFKLFDGPADGNQTGGIVEANDVDIIDGYFTVELDFGSDVFDGDARWLEVSVRPGALTDPNHYVTLPERQTVTACPYALQTRGIFVDEAKNVGIGTRTPKGKLHVDGGKAKPGLRGTDITIDAQDGGDGGGIMGDNGGHGGNIIFVPGEGGEPSGFGRRGRDGNVGIGTAAPEAMLDVRGNIKVDQKIQAYDSGGLELATDEGTTRIFVGDDGKVGIGTTSPLWELEVANHMPGNAAESAVTADDAGGAIAAYSSTFSTFPHLADRVSLFSNSLTATGLDLRADGGTSDIRFYAGGITPSTERIRITPGGNVGIGTKMPQADLEVKHRTGSHHVIQATASDGSELFYVAEHSALGNGFLGVKDGSGTSKVFITANGHSYFDGGNVAVGSTYPQARLDVDGDLKVSGAYKGDIGPNHGAPFPRPAYDSGWKAISKGGLLTLTHNVGGDVYRYVVDMQMYEGGLGIHNFKYGGDSYEGDHRGIHYYELTTSSIGIRREADDLWCEQVRIRIWVYK